MSEKIRAYILRGVVLLTLSFSTVIAAEPPEQGMILPTDVLYLSFKSMEENPTLSRQEQVGKFYGRTQTENLNDVQKFALGEVHFINIKAQEALEAFEPFMDGEGLKARIAWQRVMQIRFRGFNETERVEKMVEEYKKKFEPTRLDVWDVERQILNIGQKYQKAGEYQKVVDIITEEVDRLEVIAPFMVYLMPAYFMKSFEETGNVELAETMMQDIQNKLKNTVANYAKDHPDGHIFYKKAEYVPNREYRMEEGILGTAFGENYPSSELRFNQYNFVINELDAALWRIRLEK